MAAPRIAGRWNLLALLIVVDIAPGAACAATIMADIGRVVLRIPLVRADIFVVFVDVAVIVANVLAVILDVGALFCGIGLIAVFAIFAQLFFIFADIALVLVHVRHVLIAVGAVSVDATSVSSPIALIMPNVFAVFVQALLVLLHVAAGGGRSRVAGVRGLRNCSAGAQYARQNECCPFPRMMSHLVDLLMRLACTRVEPGCD